MQKPIKLKYAFRSYLHQEVYEADQQVCDWILKRKLLVPKQLSLYRKAKITWFAARLYPFCPLDRLVLVAKLFCVLFLLDDYTDAASDKVHFWKGLRRDLDHVLAGRKLHRISAPLACFEEIWGELGRLADADWEIYAKEIFDAFLDAGAWEAEIRQYGIIPGIADYLHYRMDFSGVRIAFLLIPVLYGNMKERLYRLGDFQPLKNHAGKVIFLANDLMSYQKEMKAEDWNNLVRLVQREEGVDLPVAFDRVFDLHYTELTKYHQVESDLTSCETPEMNAYMVALRYMIAGSAAWSSMDTNRYSQENKRKTVDF